MNRVWLAFKVFFDVLLHADRAEQIRRVEAEPPKLEASPQETPPAVPVAPPAPKPASRSDALALLETLQREARLIDFLQEEIDGYTDQQVGSAVREVHRGSRAVLQRMFSIVPVLDSEEGARITVNKDDSAARIRLVGKVVETRPATGTLVHSGWRAEQCELPKWIGSTDAAMVIAPAEVDLQ